MPNRKLAILLLAATCARTATSPRSLRSDISILITNDLLESESPYSGSGVLLLDAMDLDSAAKSCKALGETLWTPETPFSVIKPHLDYLIYQGRYSAEQRFWISSGVQHRRPHTITRTGLILPAADRERLPVLCTQSAPYSNETFSDTSSDFQVTIDSNKEHITGYRDRHAFRFLGIRYADEPERWTYSKLYQGSGSSVSALQFGNSCLQGPTTGAEDCLFLNIWTPYLPNQRGRSNLGSSLRPVLFWIHGGAFMSGKGSHPYTDGSNLASRGDVVVVAINYRLGSLGFLALHDGQTNGNFGLADQVTALDWVRKNIMDFGGDPKRVTIVGQSAGAGSVRALLASPKARGKFARAIMQSNLGGLGYGTTYSDYYTVEEQMEVAGQPILDATNCSNASSQVDCLRQLPARTIANLPATARYLVVDGTYLTGNQLDLKHRQATAHVPLLIGIMRDDGAAMIGYPSMEETLETFIRAYGLPSSALSTGLFPLPASRNTTLNKFNTTSRMATDGIFRCIDQATAYAGIKNQIFPSVHFYEFNRSYQTASYSPNPPLCEAPVTPSHPAGDPSLEYFKCHSGEIYYVFGNVRRQGLPLRDEFDLPFEQLVVDSWTSFVRTGNPTPSPGYLAARQYFNTTQDIEAAGAWNPLKPDSLSLRLFDWPGRVVPLVDLEQCRALNISLEYYL